MSKKSWLLVKGVLLVLSLVAILSLSAADFSGINQADSNFKVNVGKSPSSQAASEQKHLSRTAILVSPPQYLTRRTAEIPSCVRSK